MGIFLLNPCEGFRTSCYAWPS